MVLSSTAGTTKVVVDDLRSRGHQAGLLKRGVPPLPGPEIVQRSPTSRLSRSWIAPSRSGACERRPTFLETAAAFQVLEAGSRSHGGYVFGLGGRNHPPEIEGVYRDLLAIAETGRSGNRCGTWA